MDSLETALEGILSDPGKLRGLMQMAASLGLGSPQAPPQPETKAAAETKTPAPQASALPARPVSGGPAQALAALRPVVSERGRQAVDRGLRALRLSAAAKTVLGSLGGGHV